MTDEDLHVEGVLPFGGFITKGIKSSVSGESSPLILSLAA